MMNIKAERIESIIQVLNRNLLLIFAGQQGGIAPIEKRSLKRVDTSVFSADKYAFEMVDFVRNYRRPEKMDTPAEWEKHFVKGLELLLAECANVKDEVERDCFVSRIYSWFMEKLTERRDFDSEKDSKRAKVNVLDEAGDEEAEDPMFNTYPPGGIDPKVQDYTKHQYPRVSGAPPVGAYPEDETYGMLYNQPQTEAEIEMHELWLAKRQQEAFDLKARRQLSVVMDRRSLLKSRLESEALRRLESSTFLAASFETHNTTTGNKIRPLSGGHSRYAPIVKRPMSGKRQYMSAMENGYDELDEQLRAKSAAKQIDEPPFEELPVEEVEAAADPSTNTVIKISKQGSNIEATVAKSARNVVENKPKPAFQPMRFKTAAPEGFVVKRQKERQLAMENYLQEFDSDEEDAQKASKKAPDGAHIVRTVSAPAAPKANKVAVVVGGTQVISALMKKEAVRDRPVSAQRFREISATDSEMKVLYRYSNFRRMPMSTEQEQWLQNREDKRNKELKESLVKLAEAKKTKDAKSAAKKGDKKGSGSSKSSSSSSKKKRSACSCSA